MTVSVDPNPVPPTYFPPEEPQREEAVAETPPAPLPEESGSTVDYSV